MLTGDNRRTAAAVAGRLGIDEVEAEVLPEDKARIVQQLKAEGRIVAMAGDGVNDAPALAAADVGIAMGTGTDIAIESAGVTLVKGDLLGIVRARRLSQATMRNIRQNLFFAFVYNSAGVPLAAGVLYPLLRPAAQPDRGGGGHGAELRSASSPMRSGCGSAFAALRHVCRFSLDPLSHGRNSGPRHAPDPPLAPRRTTPSGPTSAGGELFVASVVICMILASFGDAVDPALFGEAGLEFALFDFGGELSVLAMRHWHLLQLLLAGAAGAFGSLRAARLRGRASSGSCGRPAGAPSTRCR